MKLPFSKVDCSGNERKYIDEVLNSGWLTTASKTKAFEECVKTYVGSKFACAVNSCTSALHLAIEALGVKKGDKVLLPTFTFTATAEVIQYIGAVPIFLDVEYGSCQLSRKIISDAINKHNGIKALIVVDYAGQAVPNVIDLCHPKGIKVIADSAHAFTAKLGNNMVGNIADITCFSFYANKTITTGEGGMLTTNDEKIAKRVRLMRLHGIDRDVWSRFTGNKPNWEYDICANGYKYNMPDINAAVGLAQIERAEDMRLSRQKIAEIYISELNGLMSIDLPKTNVPFQHHAWHLFPIKINEKSKIDRNKFIELLAEYGIGTSVHYKPLHRMSYYSNMYKLKDNSFPMAEKIWSGNLSLPIYSLMNEFDAKYVVKKIRQIISDA